MAGAKRRRETKTPVEQPSLKPAPRRCQSQSKVASRSSQPRRKRRAGSLSGGVARLDGSAREPRLPLGWARKATGSPPSTILGHAGKGGPRRRASSEEEEEKVGQGDSADISHAQLLRLGEKLSNWTRPGAGGVCYCGAWGSLRFSRGTLPAELGYKRNPEFFAVSPTGKAYSRGVDKARRKRQ